MTRIDSQLGQQADKAPRGHGRPAVLVYAKPPGLDPIAGDGLGEQVFGERRILPSGHPRNG